MALSLNKPKLDNLASEIWKSAERLRGKFKAYEYQSVILPIIVIRRLECVLIDWRERKAKQCPFSNRTAWTLRKIHEDAVRRHLGRQGRLREGSPQVGEDPLPRRDAASERRSAALSVNDVGQDVGWKLVCLKRLATIQTGLTLGKTYESPLVERPYLRVANVQDGHFDLDRITLIEVPPAVAASVELRAGDVLLTEGGDLDKLGRGYVWYGQIPDCLHQNHIFAVRCLSHKLRPTFLAYATASRYGRDYFEATGKRTTNLANTNATKVGHFPIPLPPVNEQDKICEFLDTKLTEVKGIAACIESQIATLTAYRKSLIHECVTGQWRITEADLSRVKNHAGT